MILCEVKDVLTKPYYGQHFTIHTCITLYALNIHYISITSQ